MSNGAEKKIELDFENRRSESWDHVARKFAPLKIDVMWEDQQRSVCTDAQYKAALQTRFYLKLLYKIFAGNYNFGKFHYRFVEFEMPDTHIDDWRRLSDDERSEMFGTLRFAPVGDDIKNENRFVFMTDDKMALMFGHLDTMFVARHGLQVPDSQIVYRQASIESALRYARYRVSADERALADVTADFAATAKPMSAADSASANEIVEQFRALVESGKRLVKTIVALKETVEKRNAAASAAVASLKPLPSESTNVNHLVHDTTRAELENFVETRDAIQKMVTEAAENK